MCGLVACITKHRNGFNHTQLAIFQTMLFLDTQRGDDSTGVFNVNNIGNVSLAKDVLTGEQFLKTKEWDTLQTAAYQTGWALVGHNRKATRGTVIDINAHPFVVDDNIVLVHNGSFLGSHKHIKDTEVDSEAIAHLIHENDGDVEKALKQVNAAYALIWYNVGEKTINVLRNNDRPLHVVETADAYYFASEKRDILYSLDKHATKYINKVELMEAFTHHKFELNTDKSTTTSREKVDCKYDYKSGSANMEHYKNPPFRTAYEHYAQFEGIDGDCGDYCYGVINNPDKDDKPELPVVATPPMRASDYQNFPIIFPWMQLYTIQEFNENKDHYKFGTKINVIIDDYVENGEEKVTVFGKTLDAFNVPVSFKLHKETVERLTAPSMEVENAVFEITIDNVTFRTLKNNVKGLMMLFGKDPEIRFMGNGHGVTGNA